VVRNSYLPETLMNGWNAMRGSEGDTPLGGLGKQPSGIAPSAALGQSISGSGTFETSRGVRYVVANGVRADIARTTHFGSFW
jgi:hypothetical protein